MSWNSKHYTPHRVHHRTCDPDCHSPQNWMYINIMDNKNLNLGQNWVFAMVFLEILPRLYLQLTSWSSDWNQNRHVNDSALSARRP